jgi:hypothetical protein
MRSGAAGEMRLQKSRKSLEDAVAAQLLPKLTVLRATTRAALATASPELYALTSPMGNRSTEVLERCRVEASRILIATMKVRCCTQQVLPCPVPEFHPG